MTTEDIFDVPLDPLKERIKETYLRWQTNREKWLQQYRTARTAVLQNLAKKRDLDAVKRGFPPGAELKLYRVWWMAGEYENGEPHWAHEWVVSPNPDADGWFTAIRWDTTQRFRLENPYGFRIEEVICRSALDVPVKFRVFVCYEERVPPAADLTNEEHWHLGLLNIKHTDEEWEALYGGWVRLPSQWLLAPTILQLLRQQKEGEDAKGS